MKASNNNFEANIKTTHTAISQSKYMGKKLKSKTCCNFFFFFFFSVWVSLEKKE
jgi:hypothetical protein